MTDTIINLNVGGHRYTTSKHTLCKNRPSMLSTMFSSDNFKLTCDSEGYYFIDRNGELFKYILKFLRDDKVNIEHLKDSEINDLLDEANFYMLEELINYINPKNSDVKRDENIEKYIKLFSTINISQFEKEFNEIFTLEYLSLIRKSDYINYDDKINAFVINLIYNMNSTPNQNEILFYNFMKKYTNSERYFLDYYIIKSIFEHLNNHSSNLFRTQFKKITINTFTNESVNVCLYL
jgi:hypothetical protein